MLKFILSGRFTAGDRVAFEGLLDVYLDDHVISVGPPRIGLGSKRLHVAPVRGSMFFGRSYEEGCGIVEKGFELALSGTNLGAYEEGGGPDGDFCIFDVKNAKLRGTFGPPGLTVNIRTRTLPGAAVCYSLRERREAAIAALDVAAEFVVSPQDLTCFLALRIPLNSDPFAKFQWKKA